MVMDIIDSGIAIPDIIDVEYLGGHKLHLLFNDGKEGDIDLAPAINHIPPYQELRDPNRFIQFGLIGGTLVWSNDLDMAPDWLYEEMLKQNGSN